MQVFELSELPSVVPEKGRTGPPIMEVTESVATSSAVTEYAHRQLVPAPADVSLASTGVKPAPSAHTGASSLDAAENVSETLSPTAALHEPGLLPVIETCESVGHSAAQLFAGSAPT
jgi:hypothetical protein